MCVLDFGVQPLSVRALLPARCPLESRLCHLLRHTLGQVL